jgi:hypothetical protein
MILFFLPVSRDKNQQPKQRDKEEEEEKEEAAPESIWK